MSIVSNVCSQYRFVGLIVCIVASIRMQMKCLRHITERAVKRNRPIHYYRKSRWQFIVNVGGDIKYENIQAGII